MLVHCASAGTSESVRAFVPIYPPRRLETRHVAVPALAGSPSTIHVPCTMLHSWTIPYWNSLAVADVTIHRGGFRFVVAGILLASLGLHSLAHIRAISPSIGFVGLLLPVTMVVPWSTLNLTTVYALVTQFQCNIMIFWSLALTVATW